MPVLPLSSETVKLISSSQVITSVSSVVKELVENSIDAGARNIEIKLDKHGLEKIEVKDDGCGIDKSDVTVMCLSSHTSKITNFSDLDSLSSYGFRGEALSSLCNVAQVNITTKTAQDSLATCYTFDTSGRVINSRPSHINKGSIVSISELFKNLPVRKQYMSNSKRANEELKRIEKVVKSLALVHPRLRLTLVHNKFLCWQKTSVANLRQSIMQVVPISMAKQLHHILHKTEQIHVEMMVPTCDCNIATLCFSSFSDAHYLFINQRFVRNKEVEKTVYDKLFEYFGVYVPGNKYPLCVTCINLPPDCIDVNLEPNKTRVYLKNQDETLDIIKQCLLLYYGTSQKESKDISVAKHVKKRKLENEFVVSEPKRKENECLVDSVKDPNIQENNTNNNLSDEQSCSVNDLNGWNHDFEQYCLHTGQSDKEAQSVNKTDANVDNKIPSLHVENGVCISNLELESSEVHRSNNIGHIRTRPERVETDFIEEQRPSSEDKIDSDVGHVHLMSESTASTFAVKDNYKMILGLPSDYIAREEAARQSSKDSDSSINSDDMIVLTEDSRSTAAESPTLSQWSRGEVAASNGKLIKGVQVATKNKLSVKEHSVASQMGCKEMTAFTKFARNMRKQILDQNPHMSFTRVAQQLKHKWQQLNIDERKTYEICDKLKNSPTLSPGQKQLRLVDMKRVSSKHKEPVIEIDVNVNTIKRMVKCLTVEEDRNTLIGQLEASRLWLYRGPQSTVSVFNLIRLTEAVKFHQYLSKYALTSKLLDDNILFSQSDIGEEQWNTLLMLDRSANGVIKDLRIIHNGFVVEINEDGLTAQITYVPQHISHCGVELLQDLLILIHKNGLQATLNQCRPLRIISLIRSEVMRECSGKEPPTDFAQVLELLNYWLSHVSLHSDICIHDLPVSKSLSI